MLNILGLAGGAGGVRQEQKILGRNPFAFAVGGLVLWLVVQPVFACVVPADLADGALVVDDVLDGIAAVECEGFADDGFEQESFAAAQSLVGGDDHDSAGVSNAIAQALRGEAIDEDRAGRADAGLGLHLGHTFNGHAEVNDDTVVFLEAARFERVGEAAGALHKLAVGDLNDHGIVGLDNQCALVAEAGFDLPVETLARGF